MSTMKKVIIKGPRKKEKIETYPLVLQTYVGEKRDNDFSFEIEKHFTILSEGNKGWKKEFNLVSWNGREARFDIREWSEDHQKMRKGLSMTEEEVLALKACLKKLDFEKETKAEVEDV